MFEDVLCVIPARAGSKGIPDKNKQTLSGVPLTIYSIRSAVEAGVSHDHIVVSTNDRDIMQYARAWGVHVRERPEELCVDKASTESALLDALENHPDTHFLQHVLLLQPTSPIRFKDRIKECLLAYLTGDYDSLLTVTKFPNLFWKQTLGSNDQLTWVSTYDTRNRPRKQDFGEEEFLYFDNGNIYITQAEALRKRKSRVGDKVCVYPISYIEGLQIDNPLELAVADGIMTSSSEGFLRQTEEDLIHGKGTISSM
jgi:N-acylneuraminate cytidylyltransferase